MIAGGKRRYGNQHTGDESNQRVYFLFPDSQYNRRADGQGQGGQGLVRGSEHGPDGRNITGIEHIAPGKGDEGAGQDGTGYPVFPAHRLVDITENILQNVPGHTGARVDRCQDEQGLEHDDELEPVLHGVPKSLTDIGENMRHTDGQRDGAARAMGDIETDQLAEDRKIDNLHVQFCKDRGRGVDRKIILRDSGLRRPAGT